LTLLILLNPPSTDSGNQLYILTTTALDRVHDRFDKMIMSRANSTPVITFSVPTVQVTPVPVGGSLLRTSTDSPNQVSHPSHLRERVGLIYELSSQPLALPRPPRCLTPYPDTSNFPHSLEPSPLSSPAFSAYTMASSNGDRTNTNTEDEGHTDIDGLDMNKNISEAGPMSPKEIMSPGARARAVSTHPAVISSRLG
jgi:hypothetical protein